MWGGKFLHMIRNIIRIEVFFNKCLERMLNIKLTERFDGFQARHKVQTLLLSDKAMTKQQICLCCFQTLN